MSENPVRRICEILYRISICGGGECVRGRGCISVYADIANIYMFLYSNAETCWMQQADSFAPL